MSGLEGKYKFVHARVRTHSESIAFFGGGAREKLVVQSRFHTVMASLRSKQRKDFFFGIAKRVIINTIPDRLQDYVRFSHASDNFSDADIKVCHCMTQPLVELYGGCTCMVVLKVS
jgi:ABC-type uncharacterized transport system fused permease/ATPase subunit